MEQTYIVFAEGKKRDLIKYEGTDRQEAITAYNKAVAKYGAAYIEINTGVTRYTPDSLPVEQVVSATYTAEEMQMSGIERAKAYVARKKAEREAKKEQEQAEREAKRDAHRQAMLDAGLTWTSTPTQAEPVAVEQVQETPAPVEPTLEEVLEIADVTPLVEVINEASDPQYPSDKVEVSVLGIGHTSTKLIGVVIDDDAAIQALIAEHCIGARVVPSWMVSEVVARRRLQEQEELQHAEQMSEAYNALQKRKQQLALMTIYTVVEDRLALPVRYLKYGATHPEWYSPRRFKDIPEAIAAGAAHLGNARYISPEDFTSEVAMRCPLYEQ